MAPIPVYANSPITAAKPDGVTPETASVAEPLTDSPSKASAAPTSTYTPFTYAAAQPGAAPSLPYSPLQPTPTTSIGSANPASPQPGSVPISSIPPPPKVGERYQPPTQTPAPPATTTMPYPHQMGIPAPTAPQPSQQRGTSTASMASSSPYGTQIPSATTGIGGEGAQNLSHPSGYHQNANASELNRYQRSAMEQRESDDGGNGLDGVWGAAKKLAQQTGERLAAVENEVWKKINKE
ncbi:hypothetical protein HD806DRAFT_33136 [Xylariaceae sp. AK1471]|nr:hypothetical protein HD806DRAFT_33136 [Xylariaceae sp. AK1471]